MSETLWSIVSVVVLLFLYFSVLHSVRNYAKSIPVSTNRGKKNSPAGVSGGLLGVVGFCLAVGFYRLAEGANVFSYLLNLFNADPDLSVVVAVAGPSFVAALVAFIAVHRLAGGRNPAALWQSIVLMLYGAVGHDLVLQKFTKIPVDETVSVVFTILACLSVIYLVLAPRSRHTYGIGL